MLEKNQVVYRFKIPTTEIPHYIEKHSFQVVDVRMSGGFFSEKEVKLKCLEDPMIKYRDGYFVHISKLDFDRAKPSGGFIFVLMKEDNELKACNIAREYLQSRIEFYQQQLAKVEKSYDILMNYVGEEKEL